jgi:hypothetical protein
MEALILVATLGGPTQKAPSEPGGFGAFDHGGG